MTQEEKFAAQFEQDVASGLVDIKFLVRHGETLSREEFFAAANQINDFKANGKVTRYDNFPDAPLVESELVYA